MCCEMRQKQRRLSVDLVQFDCTTFWHGVWRRLKLVFNSTRNFVYSKLQTGKNNDKCTTVKHKRIYKKTKDFFVQMYKNVQK